MMEYVLITLSVDFSGMIDAVNNSDYHYALY